MKKRKRWTEF